MAIRLETAIRRGDVSSITALIAEFAHATFAKLPMTYQSWWSIEDLIAYGVNHAVANVVKMYKPAKMAKAKAKYKNQWRSSTYKGRELQEEARGMFITYLYVALDNLYKDLVTEAYADKRKAAVFSADSQSVFYKGKQVSMPDILVRLKSTRYTQAEVDAVSRIDAEEAFMKVYAQSSTHLRRHLINWAIAPKVTKYKLTGRQFQAALKEFKTSNFMQLLTADLIRIIQNDALCRNRVCLNVLKYRTVVRNGKPTLEQQLLSDTLVTVG